MHHAFIWFLWNLAPSTGLEPVAYRLGGDCSILLSYEGGVMVEPRGIEPLTFALRTRHSPG